MTRFCAPAAHSPVLQLSVTQYNWHMEINGEEQIELLTVKQVAKLLQLSASSVRDLQARRQISFIKVGGALRFEKRDIIEYLKRRKVAAML